MSLGKTISEQRKKLGYTQEKLSELSGISIRTIQRIENNKVSPHSFTLNILAESLEIEPEILISKSKQGPSDYTYAKQLINLSSLGVLLLPLTNIFLPLLFWRKNNQIQEVDTLGKQVVSFQLLWTISTVILLILAPIVSKAFTGSAAIGQFPMSGLIYFSALVVNVVISLENSLSIKKNQASTLSKIPALF